MYYDRKKIAIKNIPLERWSTEEGRKKSFAAFTKYYDLLEPETKEMGIDILSDFTKGAYHRDAQNALAFIRMEEDITKIWKARGLDFDKNPPKVLST